METEGAISTMSTPSSRYSDYLKTDYWKAVTVEVKKRGDYRCQVCNSPHDLSAHHRTYENRGNELNHLGDLICLCRRCHGIFHGKNDKPATATESTSSNVRSVVDYAAVEAEMPKGEHFLLTNDMIERCRTRRGGWTGKTLSALGVRTRNNSGWRHRLIGKRILADTYRRALQGRYILQ